MHQIVGYFGLGSTPDPAEGAHSAPPDLVAGFKGCTSKRREGGKMRGGEKGEEMKKKRAEEEAGRGEERKEEG